MEKVAYIMSRFPKLTETFILYEIIALEKQGIKVEIFPLLREQAKTIHKEAQELTERAHFHPFISGKILAAHWCFIRRDFRTYFRTIAEVFSRFGCGASFSLDLLCYRGEYHFCP